jgi:hypothetical protein
MSKKVNVSMSEADFERFDRFCSAKGFKKSPLIVRLIREFMKKEGYIEQPELDITDTFTSTASIPTKNTDKSV